jgi:hypothetical protein
MALSKAERRVLIEARQRLIDFRSEYICTALSRAAWDMGPRERRAAMRLRGYIRLQLGDDCETLDAWLIRNRAQSYTPEQVREARIQWINLMLGEEHV